MIITFDKYIKKRMYQDNPESDFKEDVLRDKTFPKKMTASTENYEHIRRYLFIRRACSEAIQAFNACWRDYYKDQTGTEFPEHLYR